MDDRKFEGTSIIFQDGSKEEERIACEPRRRDPFNRAPPFIQFVPREGICVSLLSPSFRGENKQIRSTRFLQRSVRTRRRRRRRDGERVRRKRRRSLID